jgi:hypothetical protein
MGRRATLSARAEEKRQEREGCVSSITFDAGGLIVLDRNDRRVLALIARAMELGIRITIPASALAQAIRNPARQARLSGLIRQAGTDSLHSTDLMPRLSACYWREPRRPTSSTSTSSCARVGPGMPVTSDPDDLRQIAPELQLVAL